MISALRTPWRRSESGFTLLEVVTAMVILFLLLGGAGQLLRFNHQRQLERFGQEIRTRYLQALDHSARRETVTFLTLTPEAVSLAEGARGVGSQDLAARGWEALSVPEGVTLSFRRSSEDPWSTLDQTTPALRLVFSPLGVGEGCELALRDGKNEQIERFHPLTGLER